MANRIYIQIIGSNKIFDTPLLEDVTIETESSLSSWGELAPALNSLKDMLVTVGGASGNLTSGILNISNAFDLPRWNKTEPVKLSPKLAFYTKTDPELDVYYPMALLQSLNILTKNSNGTYTVPGVHVQNINQILSKLNDEPPKSLQSQASLLNTLATKRANLPDEKDFENNSKLIAVEIPGVIYLPVAMIRACTALYSKQRTESGFPLWGNLEVTITGLYPASDQIFKDTRKVLQKF